MNYRVFSICGVLLTGCFQTLDTGSDKGSTPLRLPLDFGSVDDPGDGTIPAQTSTPAIQVVTDLGTDPSPGTPQTTKPCDAISAQAIAILTTNCGKCHGSQTVIGGLPAAQGNPPWNYVDDPQKMLNPSNVTDLNGTNGNPLVPFLTNGDPRGSRIYQRMTVANLMAGVMPPSTEKQRPTISDFSLLNAWIKNCL